MITHEIAKEIAAQITGVDELKIFSLVEKMNAKQAMFRGVRYQSDFTQALSKGVEAIGAEGGGVSYWTSGERVFNANGSDHLTTYDTSFFHYALGRKQLSPRMYILATMQDRLKKNYFVPDGFIQIHEFLSPSQYECLEIIGNPLQDYPSIYPAMIALLENFVS